MVNKKWAGRLLAALVIAAVVAVGGVVDGPAAVAAPPTAPWVSPPAVGSWVSLDTPRGQIEVKMLAPGLAVYPGQLITFTPTGGVNTIFQGAPMTETYSVVRRNLFVAKAEALIASMRKTNLGAALLDQFGRMAPLPDATTGSWVRPDTTYTSNGQAVAINNVMGISDRWITTMLDDEPSENGEGTASILSAPENFTPELYTLGSTTALIQAPQAVAFHEYVHALRGLGGFTSPESAAFDMTLPVDGRQFTHRVSTEEALATGSPLLQMLALGYTLNPDGSVRLKLDPGAVNALNVAVQREATLLGRFGEATDGTFGAITTQRILSQGFTEHAFQLELGLHPRIGYTSIDTPGTPSRDYTWRDTTLATFVEALDGFTSADQLDPANSRWLKPVQPTGGAAACGSGTNASCTWSGPSLPADATASKAWTDYQAAVAGRKPIVGTPVGVQVLSPSQIDSMSVDQIMAWARKQFDQTIRMHGAFGSAGDAGTMFVGLPQTRDALNRAHPGGSTKPMDEGMDALDYVDWVKSLKAAFGADVSALQTAATLTAMVPVLAESLGIAAAIQAGDKASIAANAVSLLSTLLSLFVSNPVIATAVGMISMLVVSFIYAAVMPDPSPVAMEHLKRYRDDAFAKLIPQLASDFVKVLSEGFELSQAQQLVTLAVTDATLDQNAEAVSRLDPASGLVAADQAQQTKAELHAALQTSLTQQRANLMGAVKTAFRELIASEVKDAETQKTITDEVLPLFSGGYAWANPSGAVTAGWEYFVAVAEQQQEYYCLHGRTAPFAKRTAADFAAGADLRDCTNVIYEMNTTFVPNVIALRSTALTAPATTALDQAVDAALAKPETVANFALATVPAQTQPARERPWRIAYPVLPYDPGPAPAIPVSTGGDSPRAGEGVDPTGLIMGQGKAGTRFQVRDQDGKVYCTTQVTPYGTWGCRTSTLIAPGFTLSLWEGEKNLGPTATAPGTRLAVDLPATSVDPAAPLTLSGAGTAGHDLTVTLHHPATATAPAGTTQLPAVIVGSGNAWSATVPAGTLRPGVTTTVTVADKAVFDTRSITLTTTGTPPSTGTPPFDTTYEAETSSTGGTVTALPNGHQGRRYTAGQEAAFTVTVPAAGTYTVDVYYSAATRGANSVVTVYPNNSSIGSQRIQTTATGTKATTTLTLGAGSNTITLVPPPGGTLPDLDGIRLANR